MNLCPQAKKPHFLGKVRLFAIAFLLTLGIPASAAPPHCRGTLAQGDHHTEDIIVDGTCTVDGAGGTLEMPAIRLWLYRFPAASNLFAVPH